MNVSEARDEISRPRFRGTRRLSQITPRLLQSSKPPKLKHTVSATRGARQVCRYSLVSDSRLPALGFADFPRASMGVRDSVESVSAVDTGRQSTKAAGPDACAMGRQDNHTADGASTLGTGSIRPETAWPRMSHPYFQVHPRLWSSSACCLSSCAWMDDGGCWSSSRGWMIPSQPAVSQPPLSLRRTASHDAGSTGSPVRARPLQAGAWELSVREKPAGNRVTTSREGEGARAGGRLTGFFSSCLLVVLPLLPSFDDPGACPGRSGSSHPGPNAWRGDRSRDP